MTRGWLVAIGAVVLGATLGACGSDEPLTCELLASPSNCWADAAARAAACIPLRPQMATLSADRSRCDYADGVSVEFDAPLPQDTSDLERLGFTVRGAGCTWRFVDTFANRMELTVDGGDTIVSELHPDRSFHLHCADATYESSFDLLFTCTTPYSAPTDGFEVTASSFSFSISAVTTTEPLIQCAP